MTRTPQPAGVRGSLKWIQRAINCRPEVLDEPIRAALKETGSIEWQSPLKSDDYAEYRDGAFLDRIGQGDLRTPLSNFWPERGPQWDALGTTSGGTALLVEAKAHIGEICSPPSQASGRSRIKIEEALAATASFMSAKHVKAPWVEAFYQLANRFAHLYFLRSNNVEAWLILVNFVDDEDMNGPRSASEWEAAYEVVYHVMGIPSRNRMRQFVLHVYPSVEKLRQHAEAEP